jgi:hypothetical protein
MADTSSANTVSLEFKAELHVENDPNSFFP